MLIVGLGNPAPKYVGTRHNIGRDFIIHLAEKSRTKFESTKGGDIISVSSFFHSANPLYAARLKCYMNESGGSLMQMLSALTLPPKETLVIVDDFMIPFGTLRLRSKGSAGGHNGLQSIIDALGTEEFGRLRVGVGPSPPGEEPGDFVLNPFTSEENKKIPEVFETLQNAIQMLVREGYQNAMNQTNKAHF